MFDGFIDLGFYVVFNHFSVIYTHVFQAFRTPVLNPTVFSKQLADCPHRLVAHWWQTNDASRIFTFFSKLGWNSQPQTARDVTDGVNGTRFNFVEACLSLHCLVMLLVF